ncbi:hypothetical protein AC622_13085 [Bacillus sp. FJAT-27916]|uniref:thiamine diphosphokinase n=1 Tax=Bacillus sp. FJAT-27916 TaxID=1679169 RepID=UPI0006A08221|nr:thiamine diphosphokinase [Bacillus sp. FJAT-27916]KMY45042.1 hypothetical protein AC622_13085 [Bacillus sp. FJAT-27916]
MNIRIVAGGPEEGLPDLKAIAAMEDRQLWCGADRGALVLAERGIEMEAAFGDFDSVTEEEMDTIRQFAKDVYPYPAEKDESDLELAVEWAYGLNPDKITIYGATGGRMDHAMANMMLLASEEHLKQPVKTELVDNQNEISFYEPGVYTIHEQEKRYVSFLPISKEISGMTLTGFLYPLTNDTLIRGRTRSISNQLNSPTGTFSFTSGILMMIRSTD